MIFKNQRIFLQKKTLFTCQKALSHTVKYVKPTSTPTAPKVSVIMACPPIWKDKPPGTFTDSQKWEDIQIPGENAWQQLGWLPPLWYSRNFGLGTYIVTMPNNLDQEKEKELSEKFFQMIFSRENSFSGKEDHKLLFHCVDDFGFSLFRHFHNSGKSSRIFGCVLHEVNGFLTMPYFLRDPSQFFTYKSETNQLKYEDWAINYLKNVENGDTPLYIFSHVGSRKFSTLVKRKEKENEFRCVGVGVGEPFSDKEGFKRNVEKLFRGIDEVIFQGKVDRQKKKKDIPPFIG